MFYDKQAEITGKNFDEKVKGMISTLGLDGVAISKCIVDPKIREKISNDRAEGAAAGVGGTPTFFVNGRMLRGIAYEDLKLLINEMLAPKK
jgi:2-hydroxychromene-2-carboxylate isomerase